MLRWPTAIKFEVCIKHCGLKDITHTDDNVRLHMLHLASAKSAKKEKLQNNKQKIQYF